MRRLPVLLCAVALALAGAACSGDDGPAPVPTASATETSPSGVPSPTTSPVIPPTTGTPGPPSPTAQPDVQLPSGMPAVIDDPADLTKISAGDLSPLVPPGSTVVRSAVLARPDDPIDQVAVGWGTGEPFARRSGLIVWQRVEAQPAWHAVYAFTDPKSRGVLGVGVDQGDLTGDAIPDLLTFEDVGGSGACGTYRVIAAGDGDAAEILRRSVCDAQIQIAGGDLRVREAVFEPDDPHCCPSAFRTTVLRWNGSDWKTVSEEVSAARGMGARRVAPGRHHRPARVPAERDGSAEDRPPRHGDGRRRLNGPVVATRRPRCYAAGPPSARGSSPGTGP